MWARTRSCASQRNSTNSKKWHAAGGSFTSLERLNKTFAHNTRQWSSTSSLRITKRMSSSPLPFILTAATVANLPRAHVVVAQFFFRLRICATFPLHRGHAAVLECTSVYVCSLVSTRRSVVLVAFASTLLLRRDCVSSRCAALSSSLIL